MMFAAPPEQTLEWSDEGVEGAYRFMKRLWRAVAVHAAAVEGTALAPLEVAALTPAQREMRRLAHQLLVKVTDDLGRRRVFNTAIAAVMEFMNALAKFDDATPQGRAVTQEALEIVVTVLSPVVPHATHALWHALGHADALIDRRWPEHDPAALVRDSLEVVVQVNGKLRGKVTLFRLDRLRVQARHHDRGRPGLDEDPGPHRARACLRRDRPIRPIGPIGTCRLMTP